MCIDESHFFLFSPHYYFTLVVLSLCELHTMRLKSNTLCWRRWLWLISKSSFSILCPCLYIYERERECVSVFSLSFGYWNVIKRNAHLLDDKVCVLVCVYVCLFVLCTFCENRISLNRCSFVMYSANFFICKPICLEGLEIPFSCHYLQNGQHAIYWTVQFISLEFNYFVHSEFRMIVLETISMANIWKLLNRTSL